jgi:DNA replication protein DnaC
MPCPLCDDTGWKPLEVNGVRRVVRCDCWKDRVGRSHLEDAHIPPLYKRCDLENFRDYNDSLIRAVTAARSFSEQFPVVDKGLLFLGLPGLGKTHLAAATLKRTIERTNCRGLFYTTPELLALIRNTYNAAIKSTESDVIRPVMEVPLLVLDDLGAERPTDWVEETMNLIVNTRYNYRRATIFTTNYQLNLPQGGLPFEGKDWARFDLKERVGFRLFSRLQEMCEFLALDGVDYRELGPNATVDELIALSKKGSEAHQDPLQPRRGKPMAKARLKAGTLDLGWSGGKAGSHK